jgi:hypothetical protein
MTEAELDDVAVWRWWCEQSAAQGLPPTIEDEAVLARVITLALGPGPAQIKGGGTGE